MCRYLTFGKSTLCVIIFKKLSFQLFYVKLTFPLLHCWDTMETEETLGG